MIDTEFTLEGRTYKIVDRLGNGAFGVVYRAIHKPTSDFVAVKVMGFRFDHLALQAITNEITLVAKVKHPNVVAQLGANLAPDHPLGIYIVTEYISGGTLKDKLDGCRKNNTPIPLEHATAIMLQIAQGVKAINEHMVHRDIKPDNILFDGKNYKITDFGIAKVISEGTRDHTFKGIQHPRYCAPENWLGNHNSDKMDIYSAGLFFYELLGLKHPLEEAVTDPNDTSQWESAHIRNLCPDISLIRPEVETKLSQLLQRMTSKRAESRPSWDEIIGVLDGTEVLQPKAFNLSGLVEADTAAGLQRDVEHVKREEQQKKDKLQRELIDQEIAQIADLLDEVILSFNEEGKYEKFEIMKTNELNALRTYKSKNRSPLLLRFFQLQRPTRFPHTQEMIMAAGYIGTEPPRAAHGSLSTSLFSGSANLFLVKRNQDDHYGQRRFGSIKQHLTVNQKGSFSIDYGFGSLELLFPPPMPRPLRGRVVQKRQSAEHLVFRLDIQQAFVDLLTSATELAKAQHPGLF